MRRLWPLIFCGKRKRQRIDNGKLAARAGQGHFQGRLPQFTTRTVRSRPTIGKTNTLALQLQIHLIHLTRHFGPPCRLTHSSASKSIHQMPISMLQRADQTCTIAPTAYSGSNASSNSLWSPIFRRSRVVSASLLQLPRSHRCIINRFTRGSPGLATACLHT